MQRGKGERRLQAGQRMAYPSLMRQSLPRAPRFALSLALILGLSACATLFPPKVEAPPPVESTNALTGLGGGVSAASLDSTSADEKADAMAAPAAGERQLGHVTVALGSPTEPGFWLKSNLVTVAAKGRVEIAGGKSVAVDLLPSDGAALLSFAAFRALELALTDLPDVTVYAD